MYHLFYKKSSYTANKGVYDEIKSIKNIILLMFILGNGKQKTLLIINNLTTPLSNQGFKNTNKNEKRNRNIT